MKEEHIHAEIRSREIERTGALVRADWVMLDSILAENLVHIHATGLIEDKAAYLKGAQTKLEFKRVERVSMNLRIYGDVIISTGIIDQTLIMRGPGTVVTLSTAATQVWTQEEGHWRLAIFQNTRVG